VRTPQNRQVEQVRFSTTRKYFPSLQLERPSVRLCTRPGASHLCAARAAAMYSQCMQDWDSGTHLTKQEWERTCRRLMQERGKAALREGK
jgi:hypothetical protein